LKLSFSGECWVEVTDTEAKVLVSKVMRAQDSVELSSELPLKILLGHAEVATVIFNNQQVDLMPFTQGNVARLTLGVES
jgi:cytoskeleton protein RodZ